MLQSKVLLTILFVGAFSGAVHAQDGKGGPTPSPAGAQVYFVDVKDGDTIPTKATVHFGLRGMGVAPAGSDRANAGHHHLADRYRPAAARQAHSERLQPFALRRGTDRSRGDADAGRAHAAASVRRQGPRSALAAAFLSAHSCSGCRRSPASRNGFNSAAAGASESVAGGCEGLFRVSDQRRLCVAHAGHPVRARQYGRGAGGGRQTQYRASPPFDRRARADAQSAHSQRLQPSAFRGGSDRGQSHASARRTYAAAVAWR